jgi:hypothetical protein
MKQLLVILFLSFSLCFALPFEHVYADSYDRLVTCSSNTCTISSNEPLFSEHNWLPGSNSSKIIRIKNTKSTPLLVYTRADKKASSSNLGDVIDMKIIEKQNQIVRLDTTLAHFYERGLIGIGRINGNSHEDFIVFAELKHTTGNAYQDKQTTFDLMLNFSCNPLISPTPTIKPTPTHTPRPTPTITPKPTRTPTPTPHPHQPPRFDFWWIRHLLDKFRSFRR